jgi:hypothetical protein
MSAQKVTYRVDGYSFELYGADRKGKRTRWGDKIIHIYSGGKDVGQAVFTAEGEDTQDSYFADGKIYYFAPGSQFQGVIELLESSTVVHFAWCPVHDPKESNDGDAVFYTDRIIREIV